MKFLLNFHSLLLGKLFLLVFVHSQTVTKSYNGVFRGPICNPSDYMRYPKTADDVVAIIKEAISRNVTVKAIGARHSQTDIICTEGIPIDMSGFTSCQMNDDDTVTCGAGVTLIQLGEFLLQRGRALGPAPAFGFITLGGALGTGASGSSLKHNSTISAQVQKLTVVNGLGDKLVISDPDDLKAFKINLGLLGIVVDITLYTMPLYKVKAYNYVVSDDILTNGTALDLAKNSDQVIFYWYPARKEVVVAELTFVPADTPGTAVTNAVASATYGYFNFIATKAKEIIYGLATSDCTLASTLGNKLVRAFEIITKSSLLYQTPGCVPFYTEDGISVENPAVGYPHSMFSVACKDSNAGLAGKSCFWDHGDINSNISIVDNEIAIGLPDLKNFVATVKDVAQKTPASFPIQGIFMRLSGISDVYMSSSYQRDGISVGLPLWKRSNEYKYASGSLAAYQTILQTVAKNLTGRSHWGKTGMAYHSREMLNLRLDPTARKNFIAAMNKFDPNGRFMNNFGRRLAQNATKMDIDPKTTRCALLDYCFCSKNSDCADTQRCTTISGYSYPVCKTKNELPDTADISLIPPLSGLLDWLNVTVPALANTVLGQCSLLNGGILGVLG